MMKPNLNVLLVLKSGTEDSFQQVSGILQMHMVSPKAVTPEAFPKVIEGGVENSAGQKVTDGSVTLGDLIHLVVVTQEIVLDEQCFVAARCERMLVVILDESSPHLSQEEIRQQLSEVGLVRLRVAQLLLAVAATRLLKDLPSPVEVAVADHRRT